MRIDLSKLLMRETLIKMVRVAVVAASTGVLLSLAPFYPFFVIVLSVITLALIAYK